MYLWIMETFKDHFSKQSDIYLKYRPQYSSQLFEYLSSLSNQHQLAWDCGTGNGQAAIGLAPYFDQIIASDPSEQQIKNAIANPKIVYKIETAENSSISDHSVDLITVANAIHWLNFDAFFAEVKRVLKPDGIIMIWSYFIPSVSPEIDALIHDLHFRILNDYWLPENRLIENEYSDIQFPFKEFKHPDFFCNKLMNRNDLIGYLNTWSGTQRFINKNGFSPTDEIHDKMCYVWKNAEEEKLVQWKLILKGGSLF